MKRMTMKEVLEQERAQRSWFKALVINPIMFVVGICLGLFVLLWIWLGSIT